MTERMAITKNPISVVNGLGMVGAPLSLALLNTTTPGNNWPVQHSAFLAALGVSLMVSALYVRVSVGEGPVIRQTLGLWPFKRVRDLDIVRVDDVFVDVASTTSTQIYRTYIRWTDAQGRPRRTLLAETDPEAVRTAAEISSLFSVPVKTSPKFELLASRDTRQIVINANQDLA